MDTMRITDVLFVSVAAFTGFEIALAVNYLLLKLLLRFMTHPSREPSEPRP